MLEGDNAMEPLTINRFPIFAAWCYVIARRLGYGEEEAQSLAVTRARLGAAARAGLLGRGRGPAHHAPHAPRRGAAEPETVDQVAFVGMRPFVTRRQGGLRGVMHESDGLDIIAPRQYETSVVGKLGEAYPSVLRLLQKLAATLPADELNAQGYHLYERFAPMVRSPSGQETRPQFGQRGAFDPAKVEALIEEAAGTGTRRAA
jgi:hypothetical protein